MGETEKDFTEVIFKLWPKRHTELCRKTTAVRRRVQENLVTKWHIIWNSSETEIKLLVYTMSHTETVSNYLKDTRKCYSEMKQGGVLEIDLNHEKLMLISAV